ncbi:aldehyde dehydrogenase domain-containing protein [Thelonectria olida]|uniref:Aldehyde dehydrogenase domain-containing protein n=1 Tax=Thelonectria olida TaxID=1576542 RepID=A0A9P8W4H3_9HYPO|nr:aldehyde dehydrogenase domain-containing protein [Thelonectria olida]
MAPSANGNGESAGHGDTVPLLIDGNDVYSDDTFDVVSPGTANTVHKSSNASVTHAQNAIDAAAKAFESWNETTPSERRAILLKAADIVDKRAAEMKEYMIKETGADDAWADVNIHLGKECLLDCAGRISAIEGRVAAPADPTRGALIVKEPYGVILAIAPWNAPYALGFRAAVWAIAAGNTVVFKGSENSPRTLWAIASILQEAGLPKGVLNFLTCSPANAPDVTKALVESPTVKKINFTGSSNVGRIIAQMAGKSLKPVLLELGGKAPAIVCEDADLDVAAKECVLGAFMYSGQICMSTERILVHKSIRPALEEKLKEWVELVFSSEADAPKLITGHAVTKNKGLVRDAVSKGASLVCGNIDVEESTKTRLRPIIVSNVKPEMEIYKLESFGPTVSVIEFETEEEALRVANDTEYGLSSSIFSKDLRKALRLAKRIETGAVHINKMSVHDEAALPHGGAKSSGFGRFNTSMDEWLRTKNITYDI